MGSGKKSRVSKSKSSGAIAAARRENARLARERAKSPTRETTSERVMRQAQERVRPMIGLAALTAGEAQRKVLSPGFVWATCEEASMFSREKYLPCGASAVAVVWHEKDHHAYQMCEACADHNVRNRGGKLLARRPDLKDFASTAQAGARAARAAGASAENAARAGLDLAERATWSDPKIWRPMIPTAAVLAVKALQQERKTLEGQLERIKKDLKAQEPPIIAALEIGVPTESGCPPVAVDVEERVTPGWKAEALALAVALGKNVGVYEAEIRAKTVPTVIKRLIINGREGK